MHAPKHESQKPFAPVHRQCTPAKSLLIALKTCNAFLFQKHSKQLQTSNAGKLVKCRHTQRLPFSITQDHVMDQLHKLQKCMHPNTNHRSLFHLFTDRVHPQNHCSSHSTSVNILFLTLRPAVFVFFSKCSSGETQNDVCAHGKGTAITVSDRTPALSLS